MKDPDASVVWEVEDGEASCPIEMGSDVDLIIRICGRKLHAASGGADELPVCLMHSKDPNKQSGPLFDAFWQEFERTLNSAGEGEAHFEYFIFPQLDLRYRKFHASCQFDGATFTQGSDFSLAIFIKDVSFRRASFTQDADFGKTIFTQDGNFRFATFTQDAEFADAIFMEHAHFDSAAFMQDANFWGAAFAQDADYSHTFFMQDAYFHNATFTQNADFSESTFTQIADFVGATFTQEIDFGHVSFMQNAHFSEATFMRDTNFRFATFTQATDFWRTTFHGMADWRGSKFLDRAEFRWTKFDPLIEGEPGAVFALAQFSKPGEVVFDDVDLSSVLFHNCDVSQVWFTSSVTWVKRENNRGFAVFEESIPLDQENAKGLQRDEHRDYRAVAQIYQQLKKNYDSRLEYETANEFHFGEMEMKRLAGPTAGRLLWLRRWWHPRLSFVALYRWASDYGNSYRKPLLWLLGTLLAAALLFLIPGVGLRQPISGNAASTASVTYTRVWNRQESWTNNLWKEAKLIGKSGITAIDTATFQRTPEYTPAYPWGRVVAIVETLLTSSLFALFLLAIRRQFRR
jgi:hypothetical protein